MIASASSLSRRLLLLSAPLGRPPRLPNSRAFSFVNRMPPVYRGFRVLLFLGRQGAVSAPAEHETHRPCQHEDPLGLMSVTASRARIISAGISRSVSRC